MSAISKVETLGSPDLTEEEKHFLEAFFEAATVLPVSESVITEAIQLRQQHRMSLGDAFIGGTALSRDLRLAMHNAKDFGWMEGLEVIDRLPVRDKGLYNPSCGTEGNGERGEREHGERNRGSWGLAAD